MRIAIIAALPGELKPLVRNWRRSQTNVKGAKKWTLANGSDTWIAICAGMGAEAVRRAHALATADGPLDMLVSIGWAGALHPEIQPGTAHVPTVVIDAQTGEQFGLSEDKRKLRLVTTPRVADAAEKARLAATYSGVTLVDMEAATVARLGTMHNIPVLCIKGVSDALGADLADLNRFIDANGQMRMPSFLAHVALRPRVWPSLLHLGRNSAHAADAMRDLIQQFMKEKDVEKLIRTGSI
jgi:adenosylhomocysteine nucleosidase